MTSVEVGLLNNDALIMDLSSTEFDAFNAKLQASALAATRKSAGIPADVAFHRSMDQDLASNLDAFSERVLAMTNRLLNLASTVDHTRSKGKAKLESEDDVVDQFHSLVVDSVDQLLERTVCSSVLSYGSETHQISGYLSRPIPRKK